MTDKMSYYERMKNAVGFTMSMTLWHLMSIDSFTELGRKHFGENFASVREMMSKVPLVFANSDEILDFPRPVLHKTIYVGGLGMKNAQPIPEVF